MDNSAGCKESRPVCACTCPRRLQVYVHSQSFIWIFMAIWVVYGIGMSLFGQYARIPFISDAAEQQLR